MYLSKNLLLPLRMMRKMSRINLMNLSIKLVGGKNMLSVSLQYITIFFAQCRLQFKSKVI